MITGPLFKLFGSKWTSSKYYPAPKFDTIIEPFAGSAGYSLRHFNKNVILAEADGHVHNLWYWLINIATESDIREIPLGLPIGTDIRTIGLNMGQMLLLKNWQRTNNVGNCFTVSPWGNLSGQWTENTRSRVASEFHLIKHWKIKTGAFDTRDYEVPWTDVDNWTSWSTDALDLLKDKNLPKESTWFIDPPYEFNYKYKSGPLEYPQLGKDIQALSGQVIVCEAICTKTNQTPSWLPFVDFKKTVTSRRKQTNNHHSRELIYINER